MEGRCFVLSANQFARRSHCPGYGNSSEPGQDEIVSRGGSCIIDPMGTVLAGPNFEGEALLTADIDRNTIIRSKFDFDAVGHYARPDVFRLLVNEADAQPAVFASDGFAGEGSPKSTTS